MNSGTRMLAGIAVGVGLLIVLPDGARAQAESPGRCGGAGQFIATMAGGGGRDLADSSFDLAAPGVRDAFAGGFIQRSASRGPDRAASASPRRERSADRGPLAGGPARRGAGPAQQVALSELGSELPESGELVRRLDALGDDLQLERPGEVEDHADEPGFAPAAGEAVDERLCDLEAVERQRVEVAEGRVPRSEVVERDPHAQRP